MPAENQMRIYLNEVVFLGYHGLYAEEKKLGNTYKVDVQIDFTPHSNFVDQLDQSIDYVQVYALVKKRMDIPTSLLETLVCTIANDILLAHPIADKVFVKITKVILPIPQFDGNVSVSLEKSRH